MEIEIAEEGHRDQIARLWGMAFNYTPEQRHLRSERARLDRVLVALINGMVVGTAEWAPVDQWFGGRPIPTMAVSHVTTSPWHRGRGVGRALMEWLLRDGRSQGLALATLYASPVMFYRKLGFEFAGIRTVHRAPLEALPEGDPSGLVEVTDAGHGIRRSLSRLATTENGLISDDDDWWEYRVFGGDPRGLSATVHTNEAIPDAYVSYRHDYGAAGSSPGLVCSQLVSHTGVAARRILAFLRTFRSTMRDLEWPGPPTEPLAALLEEEAITVARTNLFMTRIIDLPRALKARGYGELSTEVNIAITDPLFAENARTWRCTVIDGQTRVDTIDSSRVGPLPIGVFTSMFTEHLSPIEVARLGWVAARDPALPALERLFRGSKPWTHQYF